MKKSQHIIPLLIFFYAFQSAEAQQCFCEKDTFLNEFILCDTAFLKANSMVYYQFNCDSSWLTFENANAEKWTIFSLDLELMFLSSKLGWHVWKDYEESVLFVARETSGLPTTLQYSLLNKHNGAVINTFRQVVYACSDSLCDFVLYFSDSSFNYLTLFMLKEKKAYKINLPKNVIIDAFGQY